MRKESKTANRHVWLMPLSTTTLSYTNFLWLVENIILLKGLQLKIYILTQVNNNLWLVYIYFSRLYFILIGSPVMTKWKYTLTIKDQVINILTPFFSIQGRKHFHPVALCYWCLGILVIKVTKLAFLTPNEIVLQYMVLGFDLSKILTCLLFGFVCLLVLFIIFASSYKDMGAVVLKTVRSVIKQEHLKNNTYLFLELVLCK